MNAESFSWRITRSFRFLRPLNAEVGGLVAAPAQRLVRHEIAGFKDDVICLQRKCCFGSIHGFAMEMAIYTGRVLSIRGLSISVSSQIFLIGPKRPNVKLPDALLFGAPG